MTQILTITLNPALDLSSDAPRVVPGPKLRMSEPVVEPGGGGINVARAIRELGGEAQAVVALGGLTGARIKALLAEAAIDLVTMPVPGETRQSLSVTDRSDAQQYRFVMPGPVWTEDLAQRMLDTLAETAGNAALVVLSGSQPPGLDEGFPQALARRLKGVSARLVVDTSGPALTRLATAPEPDTAPYCLRMDQAESEEQAGRPLPDAADSLAFAEELVARGAARVVVLARGAEGSVLAGEGQRLSCRPPRVPVVSTVGAGDSFTGAFVLALARGAGLPEALQQATAAAAAAVMTPSTRLCRREDAERLIADCVLGNP